MAFASSVDTLDGRKKAEALISEKAQEVRDWRLTSLSVAGRVQGQIDGFKGTEAQAKTMLSRLHGGAL